MKDLAIRICGRGGQGVVKAASILGEAIILENEFKNQKLHLMIIPTYGPERTGGPVKALIKMSSRPIKDRSGCKKLTHLIAFDKTIFLAENLKSDAEIDFIILNCAKKEQKHIKKRYPAAVLTDIDPSGPLDLNIAMLGLFVGATKLVSLNNFKKAILKRLPDMPPEKIELVNSIINNSYNRDKGEKNG